MTENFDLDTGKNIVDALKQQSEDDFDNENTFGDVDDLFEDVNTDEDFMDLDDNNDNDMFLTNDEINIETIETFDSNMKSNETSFDFNAYEAPQEDHAVVEKFAKDLHSFEIPQNVAVLRKLISKLPSGVTRQTGAQIIKQTMEALGISIKSVLQEAQQLQDQLSTSTKECQATIQEYKRQIATLEDQAQSYKKQYTGLNELVSLFIQTDN